MQLDFWNNPLVVSAMRLKYRRGSPGLLACLYVFVLLGVGTLLHYNAASLSMPFSRLFLIAILGIQFALSGIIGLVMVSNSMNAEVNNQTFDFQRIVSLSPREILVGKMIGEPASGYFLAMSTVPLVVLCWFQGGATFGAIVLFYVNLVTFSLMCASLGLLHTLAEPSQTPGKPRAGSLGGFAFMFLGFLPYMILQGSGAFSSPWLGTAVNLLTPIGSILELKNGDPFAALVELWSLPLPSLLVAPLAQLAVTAWFVQAMTRRLKNPNQTVFGRNDVYLVLTIVDLLVAGVCYSQWRKGWLADELVAQFCLAHIIACLFLLLGATPSRATLTTWLWRYRGQRSWSRDSLFFSSAENTLALVAMCVIGGGILLVGFVLPSWVASLDGQMPFDWGSLVENLLITSLLIIALGTTCQWCQARASKLGIFVFICVVLVLNIVPPVLAGAIEVSNLASGRDVSLDLIYSFSPAVFFISRVSYGWDYSLPSLPIIITYLLLAWIAHGLFRNWRDRKQETILRKIEQMTSDSQPVTS